MCVLYAYIFLYMLVTTINEKRGHEFKRKQEKIHRRVWKKQREGENNVIIL